MSQKIRVLRDYAAQYSDPLAVNQGDAVTVGRRDDEYPGWIWCKAASGKSGWVPESWMEINEGTGKMLRDYSARELTVCEGNNLTMIMTESGWYYCESDSGARGWIPAANAEVGS
jgi:hypothetical protein